MKSIKLPDNQKININSDLAKSKSFLFDSRNRKFLIIFIILIIIAGIYVIFNSFAGTGIVLTGAEGEFTAVNPSRILDTRTNTGGIGTFSANKEQVIKLTANAGLPATNVSSVVLNVTVLNSKNNGYVVLWPSDEAKPNTSSVNFRAGQTIANQVTVKLGSDGKIKMLSDVDGTNLLIDVSGYYSAKDGNPGSRFNFIVPTRILDSRYGVGATKATLANGQTLNVKVAGVAGVPIDARAVTLTLTSVSTSTSGYMTVWPAGLAKPIISNINYYYGANIANQVTVPIGQDGYISLYNNGSTAEAIFDLVGYYKPPLAGTETSQNGRYYAITPERVYDSRTTNNPLVGGITRDISIVSKYSKPNYSMGVNTNSTIINPTTSGYLTAWQTSTARPNISNLNYRKGINQASAVSVSTSPASSTTNINVYINSGSANIAIDLSGYFAADYQSDNNSNSSNTSTTTSTISSMPCKYTAPTEADKSGGMTYVNYTFSQNDIYEIKHDIEILNNPDGTSSKYYIQLYDANIGTSGQYYGLQTNGMAIWSRWDTNDISNIRTDSGATILNGVETGSNFISLRKNFGSLPNGLYKTRISRAEFDGVGDWFAYYVTFPGQQEQHIGDIRFPRKTTGVPASFADFGGQWNEFWGNNGTTLLPVPLLQLNVKATANGSVAAASAVGRYSKMPNSDMYTVSPGGGVHHDIGAETPRCNFPDAAGILKLW